MAAMQNVFADFIQCLQQELGIVYQPKMLNFNATAEQQTLLQNQRQPWQKLLNCVITMINWIPIENGNLLNSVNNEQKLVFAQYAAEQQWYDLQVEATIR